MSTWNFVMIKYHPKCPHRQIVWVFVCIKNYIRCKYLIYSGFIFTIGGETGF